MSSVLSVGEVVLTDRIFEECFKLLMYLCQTGRLLFKPCALTEDEFCSGSAGRDCKPTFVRPCLVALAVSIRASHRHSYTSHPVSAFPICGSDICGICVLRRVVP